MIPIRDRLPTRIVPFVNYALVALNVLAFLWKLALVEAGYERFDFDWGLVPRLVWLHPLEGSLTVLTSMFLHGGWMHIIGNMLFLWIFGDNVEDALGHGRYAFFYLLGGVVAAATQVLIDPLSTVPMIGASGAVSAVLGAYLTLYPRARVLVLVPIFILVTFFEFPAWLVILEWFVLQLLSGLGALAQASSGGGVAWFAHIGGFLGGLLLVRLLMLGRLRRGYDPWHGWRSAKMPAGEWRRRERRARRDWWEN